MNKIKQSGFLLIEVLIASILLFGLIYIFLSSMQSQSNQVDATVNGKYLSVLINNMIVDIAKNDSRCPISGSTNVSPILSCYTIHPDVQTHLKKIGFDLNNPGSLVDLHQANLLSITLTPYNNRLDSHSMYVMANAVISNLSEHALKCLSANIDRPFANTTGDTVNLILQFNLKPGCGT